MQNRPTKRRYAAGKSGQQAQSADERVSAIRARAHSASNQTRVAGQGSSANSRTSTSGKRVAAKSQANASSRAAAKPQANTTNRAAAKPQAKTVSRATATRTSPGNAGTRSASKPQARAANRSAAPKAASNVSRRRTATTKQPAHSSARAAGFAVNPKLIGAAVAAVIVLICLVVFVPKVLGGIFHPTYPVDYEYVSTSVTGVEGEVSLSYKDSYSTKVTVKPSMGRTLELQRYDSSTSEWNTVKSYDLKEGSAKSTVTVKYPKEWKTAATSTWRIYVPEYSETSEPFAASDGTKHVTETITEAVTKKVKISNKFVNCKSAVVLEADTGRVVYDYNADKRRKPASMTKIMTAILLCENKSENDPIKVTKEVLKTNYSFGLAKGDKIKAHDIMYLMMLPSANDAAAAAALSMAPTIEEFGAMMTQRAKELGCTKTNFENPHGLDSDKHYSTAHDIALIGAYAMTSPDTEMIREAALAETYDFTSLKKHTYSLVTTNGLLGIDGVKGLKTGSTDGAGSCFCGAYYVGEKLYITVVMGDVVGDGSRWADTKSLMAFARYAAKKNL